MAVGFVLISAEPKQERQVYETLLQVKEVVELYPLFGEYDLIAKVESRDLNSIGEVVVAKIRTIDGVRATKTLTKVAL